MNKLLELSAELAKQALLDIQHFVVAKPAIARSANDLGVESADAALSSSKASDDRDVNTFPDKILSNKFFLLTLKRFSVFTR